MHRHKTHIRGVCGGGHGFGEGGGSGQGKSQPSEEEARSECGIAHGSEVTIKSSKDVGMRKRARLRSRHSSYLCPCLGGKRPGDGAVPVQREWRARGHRAESDEAKV